jgi:hypothetical protein
MPSLVINDLRESLSLFWGKQKQSFCDGEKKFPLPVHMNSISGPEHGERQFSRILASNEGGWLPIRGTVIGRT